jgi:hypothetical protein
MWNSRRFHYGPSSIATLMNLSILSTVQPMSNSMFYSQSQVCVSFDCGLTITAVGILEFDHRWTIHCPFLFLNSQHQINIFWKIYFSIFRSLLPLDREYWFLYALISNDESRNCKRNWMPDWLEALQQLRKATRDVPQQREYHPPSIVEELANALLLHNHVYTFFSLLFSVEHCKFIGRTNIKNSRSQINR